MHLLQRVIGVKSNCLYQCIVFEVFIGDKFCNLISLYRSLSPSANIFENFLDGSEQILENVAFVSVALEDFNVKSMNWYKHERTSYEETKIEVAPA